MTNKPLMITCPLVGAELTREDISVLPITPDEIAEAAKEAVEAGASIIHLHVRDKNGKPSQNVDIFKEVTEKIRRLCDCVIQYSTGGAIGTSLEERCAPLKLKPDMASISMGTMNFGTGIFENNEHTIRTIAKNIMDNNIMPELEVFDCGMLDTMERFQKKGYLPQKNHLEFVLGVPGGMSGELNNLLFLVNRLKDGRTWSVAGIGRYQLPLATHAIALGGHVRIGFEDNFYYRKKQPAISNAQLIKRIVRIAKELDREAATYEQTRKILGLT